MESQLDLWTDVVDTSMQHPNFRRIKASAGEGREVLDTWAAGFADRDGKFVREFQTTFNSSFWELYLFAALKELGFQVDLPKRPDFIIKDQDISVAAEAVIAEAPHGTLGEAEGEYTNPASIDKDHIIELSTIRLTNSFSAKLNKYRREYSKLGSVHKRPFILCIAPFEQPLFWIQGHRAINRVLYGLGEPVVSLGSSGEVEAIFGGTWHDDVQKANGARIPLGYFADDRAHEVSAVAFSSLATWGKARALSHKNFTAFFMSKRLDITGTKPRVELQPKSQYSESLLDGMHLMLNPFASRPIDPDRFLEHGVAVHRADRISGLYSVDAPDGFLLERMMFTVVDGASAGELRQIARSPYTPPVREWKDRELHKVGGELGPFVDNHIAAYRGWTVVVSRDSVDGNWGGMAREGQFRSLERFVRAGREISPSPREVIADWFETPSEALDDLCARVDDLMQ